MQEILHTTIIAIPVAFTALMVLDLIANLKRRFAACKPSIPVSIPATEPQPVLEEVAPAPKRRGRPRKAA